MSRSNTPSSTGCIYNGNIIISEKSDLIHIGKIKKNEIGLVTDMSNKCSNCKTRVTCNIIFENNPIFLFIEPRSHFKINELPKTLNCDNKNFKLLCSILYRENIKHFVSIFEIDNQKYLVDDMLNSAPLLILNQTNKGLNFFKFNISSALYYLVQ